MPTYTFKNTETEEETSEFMSISAMESKIADGKYSVVIRPTPSVSGINLKPDIGFREVLQRIKRGNPRSNVNTF